jgi:hypothetical protein
MWRSSLSSASILSSCPLSLLSSHLVHRPPLLLPLPPSSSLLLDPPPPPSAAGASTVCSSRGRTDTARRRSPSSVQWRRRRRWRRRRWRRRRRRRAGLGRVRVRSHGACAARWICAATCHSHPLPHDHSLLTARCSLLAAYCSSLTTVRCGYMPLSLVLRINGEPHRALAVAERCVHLMPTPKP